VQQLEQPMIGDKRKIRRVKFQRGVPAHMMAIDGTWRRACKMEDVQTPARN
jgi:DTW domain-containing protein YfiP